jgi:hypothetical protein
MWGWDGFIAVLLGIAAWRMAYVGVHVTIHPSQTRKGRSKKSVKIEFYCIAIASTALIMVQAYRTNKAYSDLMAAVQKNQSPQVGLAFMDLRPPTQQLIANRDLDIGMSFLVSEGTAQNMRCNFQAFSLPGPESDEQNSKARQRFRQTISSDSPATGEDRIAGTNCHKDMTVKLSDIEIAQLIAVDGLPANRMIYAMGHAEWKNSAAADFHTEVCKWMESPKTNVLVRPGWHDCAQ